MNEARSLHGSCAASNYVYVASGTFWDFYAYDEFDRPLYASKNLQSIERIDMNAIHCGWELL